MANVWLVESPRQVERNLSDLLNGDFAVRRIASLESFAKIIRYDHDQRPDCFVFNCVLTYEDYRKIESRISHVLPESYRIYRSEEPLPEATPMTDGGGGVVYQFSEWVCRFDFSQFLRQLIGEKKRAVRSSSISYKGLKLDLNRQRVVLDCGKVLDNFSPKEIQILHLLMENKARCVSRGEIHERVWSGVQVSPRTVDSHLSRLRKKLSGVSTQIESVYGGGYILS